MIREVIDMIPFRNLAEEAMNCWLSYTMSMPVCFDLSVIFLFLVQYMGFRQIWDFCSQLGTRMLAHAQTHKIEFIDHHENSLKV